MHIMEDSVNIRKDKWEGCEATWKAIKYPIKERTEYKMVSKM